jgi:hypothetical protein
VPPGCGFVPLDGKVTLRDDLRWLAASYEPESGEDFPTYYAVELAGGAAAHVLKGTHQGSPVQLRWTPDGRTLVTLNSLHTGYGKLELWDTTQWTLRAEDLIYCADHADISGDGSWVGAVGCSGHHVVIDTRAGARAETWQRGGMRMHGDNDVDSAQSPDSKSWLVTDYDGEVELFTVHPLHLRRLVLKERADEGLAPPIAWSPDGRAFATSESDGAIRIWDGATGAPRRVVRKPLGKVGEHRAKIAWGPDGADGVLATAEADDTIHLWDPAKGALTGTLGPPPGPVSPDDYGSISLSFLGKDRIRLCTGVDEKKHVTVYERSSGRALFHRDGCGAPSPDGERLLFKTAGHLEIVDARTGAVARRIAWTPGVQGEGERWAGGGRFVTWTEGKPLGDHGWSGHLVRALRVADGALLWMALLDGPGGPRLVAQGEGGAYTGPSATCLPGPPTAKAPSEKPALVAEFFAASP